MPIVFKARPMTPEEEAEMDIINAQADKLLQDASRQATAEEKLKREKKKP